MSRKQLYKYINQSKPVLEIGPRDNPFVKRETHNVYYADIRDTAGVTAIYKDYVNVDKNKIIPIDYEITGTYREAVGKRLFSTVFSSHVIEHTVDFIGHLIEINEVLEENGRYIMVVPDKRFTFDHFRAVTPFRDVYDVFLNGENSLKRLVFDYYFNVTDKLSNHPREYLSRLQSFENLAVDDNIAGFASAQVDKLEDIIGALHYWVFTFPSFCALIRDCLRMNLLPYSLEYASGTEIATQEFSIILKKDKRIMEVPHYRTEEIVRINKLIEWPCGMHELQSFCQENNTVYIYGSAVDGKYILNRIFMCGYYCRVGGLLISDSYPKECFKLPVYWISEITPRSDVGIILAMHESSKVQVLQKLKCIGFKNILENPLVD